jgi:hypothetical protein
MRILEAATAAFSKLFVSLQSEVATQHCSSANDFQNLALNAFKGHSGAIGWDSKGVSAGNGGAGQDGGLSLKQHMQWNNTS